MNIVGSYFHGRKKLIKMINGLRFIVGNGCNYNCFFCHHEGYFNKEYLKIDSEKLKKIYDFTQKNGINNISITGGEPFMYWDNTSKILNQFNSKYYIKTLNSNISLVDKYIEELKKLNSIEFHINLSSLNNIVHQKITGTKYLSHVLNNLELLHNTKHKICLNIPVLKGFNLNELKDLYQYAKERGFIPRFLVLMAVTDDFKKNVATIEKIIDEFGGGNIIDKYSYGLYKAKTPIGVIDITKCLCDDMECDICKKNTYMHLTPNLDIKYCMKSNDVVKIDFENEKTIENSFEEANKRLELIKR